MADCPCWADRSMVAYVGCYTDDMNPNGIHVADVDPCTGEMGLLSSVRLPNAIYQAITPDRRFLVSCEQGGLAAFRIVGDDLVLSDRLPLCGQCLCHVSVMPNGSRVCWADYLAGEAGSVGFDEGRFEQESLMRHRHDGSGPNLPRQATAHCHQAIPLPNGSGYVVVDLGLDRLSVYPNGWHSQTVLAGAGPRHLAFHPNGRFAFVASELGNLLSAYRLDEGHLFSLLSSVATLPEGWMGASSAAAVRVSEDGSKVYVSNRGHDSIAAFGFDQSSGMLEPLSFSPMPGKTPRDFVFLLGDRMALAVLEQSGSLVSLSCDSATGRLIPLHRIDGLYRPSSVVV